LARMRGTTYFDELRALGFAAVADLLKEIHERRNAFARIAASDRATRRVTYLRDSPAKFERRRIAVCR
jgi:hypothetical protein